MIILLIGSLILLCVAIAGGFLLLCFHVLVIALIGAAVAGCIAIGIIALICKITGTSIQEYRRKHKKKVFTEQPELIESEEDDSEEDDSDDNDCEEPDTDDIYDTDDYDRMERERRAQKGMILNEIKNYYDYDLSEDEIVEEISKKYHADPAYVRFLMNL